MALSPRVASLLADKMGTSAKDLWAISQNTGGKVAFNTVKSPYDVWSGQYSQIRPRGATFMHPEGIDAAWKAAGGK
jgi:hypothetical protein